MEQIKESIESLAASVHSRMAAFEEELKSPAAKADTVKSISADFQCFRAFVMASFGALQKQVQMLTAEVDAMEMRSRRKMLLVHGVPEVKEENTASLVLDVARTHLSMAELKPEDLRRAHRMGRPSAVSGKPRPVLVKFQDIGVRNKVWMSKTAFKGTSFTISEFLTPRRHKLFREARQKLGVTKCWTRDGQIFAVSPDGKRQSIASSQDLERLISPGVVPSNANNDAGSSKRARTTASTAKK